MNRFSLLSAQIAVAALLALAVLTLGGPNGAAAQSGSGPESYITVVIAEGDDTVSWSDPDQCSSDYSLYFVVYLLQEDPLRTLLASPASGSTEETLAISLGTDDWQSVIRMDVELFCGTFDPQYRPGFPGQFHQPVLKEGQNPGRHLFLQAVNRAVDQSGRNLACL